MTDLERIRNIAQRVADYYAGNGTELQQVLTEAFSMFAAIIDDEITTIDQQDVERRYD